MTTIVCTVLSKNYLAAARTLMLSVKQHHADARLVVLLVDAVDGYFDPAQEPFQVILASEIGIPDWAHFSMKYDVLELNTAVKPYWFEYLFDRFDAQKIIYFDPDVVIYGPLDDLLALLDQHVFVLVPHILKPIEDTFQPDELTFLRVGTFNLGFFAVARRGQWRALLRWWQRRLYHHCTHETERGLFVDQHWMDLALCLFEGGCVWRDPGCDVAYWNFQERPLTLEEHDYTVNGSQLKFFHFSGFSIKGMEGVSRHQNRFKLSDLSEHYRACFTDYRDRLIRNGYDDSHHWPYAYGTFRDGVPIPKALRICLRMYDPDAQRWPDPFDIARDDSFRRWAAHPTAELNTRYLSPYALAVHQMYREEQFDIPDTASEGGRAAARWFVDNTNAAEAFHSFYTSPVRAALAEQGRLGKKRLGVSLPSFMERLQMTWRYYRDYPQHVRPYLPANVLDVIPEIYTGPGGLYRSLKVAFKRLGILGRVRHLVGMRAILTTRYFFSYPHVSRLTDGSSERPMLTHLNSQSDSVGVNPLGVNVVGYVYSETGVGELARQTLHALKSVGFPLAVHPIEEYDAARKNDRMADLFDQATIYPVNIFHVNADMTRLVHEQIAPSLYQRRYNIGCWVWEMAHFPERWQQAFDVYDEIWVPSTFVQMAVAAHSLKPVVLMPVSIERLLPENISRATLGLPEDRYVFLFMFDMFSVIERKNPWAIIRAFEEAFSEAERRNKVTLVVKVNNLDAVPGEASRLRQEMSRVNGHLIDSYFDRLQTNGLLSMCDAYVSLHRSEGYGFTLAEAMYFGKPAIATAYSGNMDFMTVDNSYLVPYRLVELERDYPPYDAGGVWADPDVHAAANLLRRVYEHPDEASEYGQRAAAFIRQYYHPAAVGRTMVSRLNRVWAHLSS